MQSIDFPWSDNWCIEDDKAWFCAGNIGALFCVDMNSQECKLIERIPECDFTNFRLYSYCIKYEDLIFCLPSIASCIWCYDLKKDIWEKIEVGNKNQLMAVMNVYAQSDTRIWLLEDRADKIFEINLKEKAIERIYNLPVNESEIFDGGVLVEDGLYCVAEDKVYCVSRNYEDIKVYKIDGIKSGLTTISYDGCNFWISGFCKEIYVWNPAQGIVRILTEFPERFGIYNFGKNVPPLVNYESLFSMEYPFFIMSIPLGKYIWYIPLQSNEILYIDKRTYKINILEIEGEQETEESLQRNFCSKYLVQYIRKNRYIGLYSLKRQLVFEIDTEKLYVKKRDYRLSDESIAKIASEIESYNRQKDLQEDLKNYDSRKLLKESRKREQILFSAILKKENKKPEKNFGSVGDTIYCTLNK